MTDQPLVNDFDDTPRGRAARVLSTAMQQGFEDALLHGSDVPCPHQADTLEARGWRMGFELFRNPQPTEPRLAVTDEPKTGEEMTSYIESVVLAADTPFTESRIQTLTIFDRGTPVASIPSEGPATFDWEAIERMASTPAGTGEDPMVIGVCRGLVEARNAGAEAQDD